MARLNKTPLTLRVRRGTVAQITATSPAPYQKEGELAYATDTGGFYISDGTQFNLLAAGLQDLQSVTDVGNTTTNTIDTAGTKSDYFLLDTLATPTLQPGMFGWNDAFGTADLRLKGNNVTLQVGQEILARVVNKTGADLLESEYKVVRVRIASEGGAQGQRLAVVLAQGDNDPDSVTTLGIVTETILDNQEGFITILGNVSEINTTGSLQGETWVDGDVLFLSPTTPGGLTKVKPQAPDHTVVMGYVVYAHANHGKIFVKVDNGYEIDELHNVLINSAASGQLLKYNGTVWENWTPNFLTTVPTLQQVTTAGNTTSNPIAIGTTSIPSLGYDTKLYIEGSGSSVSGRTAFVVKNTNSSSAALFQLINSSGKSIAAQISGPSYAVGEQALFFTAGAIPIGFMTDGGVSSGGTSRINFYAGGYGVSPTMVITPGNTGNVLIGTTTDSGYKLDVNGNVRFSGDLLIESERFDVVNSDSSGVATFKVGSSFGSPYNNLYVSHYGSSYVAQGLRLPNSTVIIGGYGDTNGLTIGTDNALADLRFFTSGLGGGLSNVRLNIKASTGNIQIGTTTDAGYKLDVNGTVRVSGVATLSTGTTVTSVASNDSSFSIIRPIAGSTLTITVRNNTSTQSEGVNITRTNNTWLKFIRGTTVDFNISDTGNFLIGTTTDAGYKLDVNGPTRLFGSVKIESGGLDVLGTIYADLSQGTGNRMVFYNSVSRQITFDEYIPAVYITNTQISNWDTAYSWGNHATAGYLTSYTETDTLDSVTSRGNTTANAITVGNLVVNTTNQLVDFRSIGPIKAVFSNIDNPTPPFGTAGFAIHTGNYGTSLYSTKEMSFGIVPDNNLYSGSSPTVFFKNGSFGSAYAPNSLSVGTGIQYGTSFHVRSNNDSVIATSTWIAQFFGATTTQRFGIRNDGLFVFNTDALYIQPNKNIGIGTTTDAGYKLDVNGTARFSGSIRTQTGSEEVAIDFAGIYMNRFYSYIRPDINNSRALFFGDATKGSVDWGSVTFHTTGFSVNATNMSFLTGNVGVGTTSPYYKIHTVFTDNTTTLSGGASGNWGGNGIRIDNASTTTGAMALIQFRTSTTDWHIGNRLVGITPDRSDFFFKHENNEYVTFLNNGNVGINTTSPFARLHVRDGYTNTGTLAVGHQSFPGLLYSSADTGEFRIDNRSSAPSGYITFYPNGEGGTLGNEAMRIIANRNVGIGTTSPTYKLHVAGTTRNTLTRIDITPTSSTLALDIRGTGTPNDYFSVSNGTGGANDVFFPVFFYKAASYGYNGGPNRYPSGVYAGGFVAAVDDIAYNNATGAGAAMHFNARNYTNTGGLNNRALFSWGNWFTTHMVMFPTGNLVLGSQTDNGLGKLQVEGDITASVYHAQGLMGWSGVIPVPGNPPGMQNIEVTGGIITNVF